MMYKVMYKGQYERLDLWIVFQYTSYCQQVWKRLRIIKVYEPLNVHIRAMSNRLNKLTEMRSAPGISYPFPTVRVRNVSLIGELTYERILVASAYLQLKKDLF